MGPMLAVMLLYLKTSLVLTAVLMLALQLLFSAGALYLVAAAAGGAVAWAGSACWAGYWEPRPPGRTPPRTTMACLGCPWTPRRAR